MLAKRGQDIDIVDNGYDAVLAVQGKKYDVVPIDVQMPQMDGLEATRRIRALPIVQPNIVALTANSQLEEQQACRGAGMDDYLSKPVRARQLQTGLHATAVS
jgi:CheY-like chemotaxis protein